MAAKRISTPDEVAAARAAVAGIDWAAPWLAPWRTVGQAAAARVRSGATQADALNATHAECGGLSPVSFVPQAELPAGVAYEQYIFEHRRVPTREGLHDFFNAMMWLHLPRTKARLNRLHHDEIARNGVQARRGPLRDAITLFDENAALLWAPDALWQALAERRWADLFGPLRPLWAQAQLFLFGHAAVEKLEAPFKAITAHVMRVAVPVDDLPALDDWLARTLSAPLLAAKPFAALPLLGVPGWWPDNEDPAFYRDAQVFRPLRLNAPVLP